MALTVRRLVAQPGLGLHLVAGADSAERTIGWAHAIDLPDPTPWLEGGELVMTTGSHLEDNPYTQYEYARGIARAGSVALAFDTTTRYPSPPDPIVQAGNEIGLPIIRVAADTPFIAISRAVFEEVAADQVRAVQSVVEVQGRFVQAALHGGIPGLVDTLARQAGISVCVIDRMGVVLASAGPNHALLIDKVLQQTSSARPHASLGSRVFADDDGQIALQKLSVLGDRLGFLAALSNEPLDTTERLIVGHAASLISVELAKPIRLQDAEQRLRAVVTRMMLCSGTEVDPTLLRYFDLDLNSDVTVSVFTSVGNFISAIGCVIDVLNESKCAFLIDEIPGRPEDLVVITGADPADRDPVYGIPARVQHRLRTQLARTVGAGISDPAPLSTAPAAQRQAIAAARLSDTHGRLPVAFRDLGTFSLLIGSQPDDVLRSASAAVLSPLDQYDRANTVCSGRSSRSVLIDSLDAYLRHNGHWEVAAADLHVHRHTLRNRIKRISDLLERDLESAYVRAELWLALRAREILPDS